MVTLATTSLSSLFSCSHLVLSWHFALRQFYERALPSPPAESRALFITPHLLIARGGGAINRGGFPATTVYCYRRGACFITRYRKKQEQQILKWPLLALLFEWREDVLRAADLSLRVGLDILCLVAQYS